MSLQIPWLTIVQDADPDWNRDKSRELEYEFSRRTFFANRGARGAYHIPDFEFEASFGTDFTSLHWALETET